MSSCKINSNETRYLAIPTAFKHRDKKNEKGAPFRMYEVVLFGRYGAYGECGLRRITGIEDGELQTRGLDPKEYQNMRKWVTDRSLLNQSYAGARVSKAEVISMLSE